MNIQADKDVKAHKVTPMMKQFLGIKAEAGPDVLLFFRMGDFYELFFDDAIRAADALDIALTKRGKHNGFDIPMCGVPVHASETYLHRLIKKGFKVAVCEQTETPIEAKKRGYKAVVNREITRVVTPGTLTEEALLDSRGQNFILSIYKSLLGEYAIAWADISDGSFNVSEVDSMNLPSKLAALSPSEVIIPELLYQDSEFLKTLHLRDTSLTPQPAIKFNYRSAEAHLKKCFNVKSLQGFGSFTKAEISAAGALLNYLELTQAGNKVQLSNLKQNSTSNYLIIDPATRASLEIDRNQRGLKDGSLLSVVDRTVTGAGARLLKQRLNSPLIDSSEINKRLDSVGFFIKKNEILQKLRTELRKMGDMARSVSRLGLGRGSPKDILTLSQGLMLCQEIENFFHDVTDLKKIDNVFNAVKKLKISNNSSLFRFALESSEAFLPDAPLNLRQGGFIATGWSSELDELKILRSDSRQHIANLQAEYIKISSIPTLKVKHNNILGYFIEITPKYSNKMDDEHLKEIFIHRQTLGGCVRYTTTDLADLDSRITTARDRALALEIDIFQEFVARSISLTEEIREVALALATLDVLSATSVWANETIAIRPLVDNSTAFSVKDGRHPVVERSLSKLPDSNFTPNDCEIDAEINLGPRLTLITGPNMAGKSTYLRQNAIMVILAQSGFYVPATAAQIGVVDRLFSRVGASDDLSRGQSTFMVEMLETAAILNLATNRSFVILDEIGRGTSTFDGLAIAWSVADHLFKVNQSRTLFATHYHELTKMIESTDGTKNVSLKAKEWNGELIFLHDLMAGAADKSYGIQVAKLAGLPVAALRRAQDVLSLLEADHKNKGSIIDDLPLFEVSEPSQNVQKLETLELIKNLNTDELTPRAALDFLYELKMKLSND
jgi:DNA mismatch repair protein MutS